VKGTRALWISILFVLVLVAGGIAMFGRGTGPILGLDLEGGVSVILSAPRGTSSAVMNQAVQNIRNRVDALGVAEPQIFVSGNSIDVEIPGLAQGKIEQRPKRQWCLVGTGGQSYGCSPSEAEATAALDAVTVKPLVTQVCLTGLEANTPPCFGSQSEADAALEKIEVRPESAVSPTPTPPVAPGASPSPGVSTGRWCLANTGLATAPCYPAKADARAALDALGTQATQEYCLVGKDGTTLENDQRQSACFPTRDAGNSALSPLRVRGLSTEYCVVSAAGKELGCYVTPTSAQVRLQSTGQARLLQVIGTTARLEQRLVLAATPSGDPNYQATPVTCDWRVKPTPPDCSFQALKDQPVTFLGDDGTTKYQLGPVLITGDAIKKATAVYRTATTTNLQTGWEIDFQLTSEGSKAFSDVTTQNVGKRLAIVVDNQVISAPTIQSAITNGSGVITGSFTEQRAKDLATQLNAGALPVNLTKQQVVVVSPTLGRESLHQGVIAGVVGLVLLALYLLFYYRLLGVVTWFGMSIWAVLALGLVSILGRTAGYTLTLAGVAGLIVSLGITADSYIVFYERLKDEVRGGKTPRAAIQPAFRRAFRTILTADFVTFLAALILYLVAVSSVRGFALTLGLSTLLDVFVVYFFKRPTVFLIARNERLQTLRGFGLASGVAAEPVPVAGGSR